MDIFQFIKSARRSRPGLVQNVVSMCVVYACAIVLSVVSLVSIPSPHSRKEPFPRLFSRVWGRPGYEANLQCMLV